MFLALPIRDEPRAPGRPWATYGLIAVNVGVFLIVALPLMGTGVDPSDPAVREYLAVTARLTGASYAQLLVHTSAYDVFLFHYGFRAAAPSLPTLVTYMFLHGSWLHLAGNMLFLWVAGRNVENRMSPLVYTLAYLAMGLLAGAVYWSLSGHSPAPMVGASGAVFGVMGCYFMWFPRNRVVLLVVILWLVRLVPFPARWVVGFYVLVADLLPMILGETGNVAHSAHIGGFGGGLLVAWGLTRLVERRGGGEPTAPDAPPSPGTPLGSVQQGPQEILEAARAAGGWPAALREYTLMSAAARSHLPAGLVFGLADGLAADGSYDAALAVLRRFISTRPMSSDLPAAHLRAAIIHLRGLGRMTAAHQHLLTVLDLDSSLEQERTVRELLEEIEASSRDRVH